jgi:hypothetical protein
VVRNPYLDEWESQLDQQSVREARLLAADAQRDFDAVAEILSFRKGLMRKYAHAIPTAEALATIARFGPVLEIGAGTGYWASLLKQCGVDVLCYDTAPPSAVATANRFHGNAGVWTDVARGNETVIDLFPQRTLLLCWPPPRDEMPFRALRRYRGRSFIYIGELPRGGDSEGVTVSSQFLSSLESEWRLIQSVELPHWEICWDNLYIFERQLS